MKIIISVIIGFLFAESGLNLYSFYTIHDSSKIIQILKENDRLIQQKMYKSNRWTKYDLDQVASQIKDTSEKERVLAKMRIEQKETRFFHYNKDYIEVFISVDNDRCRLLAKNSSLSIKISNLIGLDSLWNNKDYTVDNKICNSLYGYGSINTLK